MAFTVFSLQTKDSKVTVWAITLGGDAIYREGVSPASPVVSIYGVLKHFILINLLYILGQSCEDSL